MQETETIKLPVSGQEVIIRGYVTGLIDQEVRKVLLGGNKARYEVDSSSIDPNSPDELPQNGKMIMDTDPTAQLNADNKLLELMVTALDGGTGDVFNRLMALPAQDVQYVTDRVKALQAAGEVSDAEKKA